jgi:signal transduction histidine kinase
MPEWHQRLMITMYVAIACLALSAAASSASVFFDFIGYIMLAGLLYVIYNVEEFRQVRFLFTAILPYLIAAFVDETVKLVNKDLYNKVGAVTGAAKTFAVLWGIGVWFVTRKQQKELTKAREKALEEERNNKVISAMKAQLEVQVAERTAELTRQKEALQSTLDELKSTQAQLVQSEKMASLGELTAGIAHEIQNPLNFVSNFSDVNNELIDEMLGEIGNNNMEDAKLIAHDIKENNCKIIFHGKRADGIVKGMLQHSRKNTGQKETTDINALCDEYVRLSFHGLRAKDKSFNAKFETDFDETIGKIDIVPQDIGRVLLNLLNNAFYAVNEKKKTAGENYQPTVWVKTKKLNTPLEPAPNSLRGDGDVEIKVEDNGNGIPQNIIDKIFQPFFTTKPTGQGTGLGLSLAYDIVTKEHNGNLSVESKEGEGCCFVVRLPFNRNTR